MAEGGQKKISCAEELHVLSEAYFSRQMENQKPFTMAGLARAVGLTRSDSLMAYRKSEGYEEYWDVANAAVLRIEEYVNEACYNKGVNVAAPIFILKNMGYTDRPEGATDTVHIKIEGLAAKL